MKVNTGIKLFKQEVQFVAGVANINQFPKLSLPEIAFIGKSNVGKSSLINSICNRKSLARVSHTPGRTQQINYFSLADKLLLCDLPGYGFAKVSQNQRNNWEKLISYYLEKSINLILVNLLIDARRGIKPNDIQMMKMLDDFDINFQIIITKSDKEKISEAYIQDINNNLATLGLTDQIVIYTSSRSKIGIKELQHSIINNIA